ncbi:MAG: MafI family immunity protein [Candidatus Entotheonellia bacterium]
MYDYQTLEQKLNAVVTAAGPQLSTMDAHDIREFITAGEYGLAFDLLCHALLQSHHPVTAEAYTLIDQLGKQMELDPRTWEPIKPLIAS